MSADQKTRRTGRLAAAMFSQLDAPTTEEIRQDAASTTANVHHNAGTVPSSFPQSAAVAPAPAPKIAAPAPAPTAPVVDDAAEDENEKVTVIIPKRLLAIVDAERKRLEKRGMKLSRSALLRSYIVERLVPDEN